MVVRLGALPRLPYYHSLPCDARGRVLSRCHASVQSDIEGVTAGSTTFPRAGNPASRSRPGFGNVNMTAPDI